MDIIKSLCKKHNVPYKPVLKHFTIFQRNYISELKDCTENLVKIYAISFFHYYCKIKIKSAEVLKEYGIKAYIFRNAYSEIENNFCEDDAEEEEWVCNLYSIRNS